MPQGYHTITTRRTYPMESYQDVVWGPRPSAQNIYLKRKRIKHKIINKEIINKVQILKIVK